MKHNLGKFDLNLLTAFDTLMTERGVTRAGKSMGITQAAMSNTLRRLREIFDDPLFVKSGYNMEPTARALELAGPISQSLHFVRQALEQGRFDPLLSCHTFRIGMVEYASAILLPLLLNHLQTVAPGVVIDVVDVGGADEVASLDNGQVDMVFSRFQWLPPKISLHRLFNTEYVAIFRQDHPLVQERLTLEAFLQTRHIHYYPRGMESTVVDEALEQMGLKRNIVAKTFSMGPIPCILRQTDMMAVMPDRTAQYIAQAVGLRVEKLPFKTPKLRLAYAWHPRTENSPPQIWLREQVKLLLQSGSPPEDDAV